MLRDLETTWAVISQWAEDGRKWHEFLKKLNILGRAIGQGRGHPLAPRFMLELYQRFATDRSMMPSANTVRSFNNQDLTGWLCGWDKWPVWIAPMLFNFSIPQNERVILAELRIAPCIRRGKRNESWSLESDGDFEKEQEEFGGNEEGDGTDKNQEHIKSKEDTTWRHQEKILENGVSEMFGTQNWWEFQGKEEGEKKIRGQHEVQKEEDWKILKVSEILDKEQENNKQTNRRERTSISGDVEIQEKHKEEDEKESASTSGVCHRSPLYVNFKQIGWDEWIIAPHGYQAYQCVGLCSFPLGNQQPPTKHALIRASLRHRRPHVLHSLHRPGRPCCVPTRLNPISILYLDSKGVVTYKYKYEGMSVAECGCR
uniref:Bone morphogenetic protein 10 n=1 Tax=Eptatretus burgeri TaxID=7764 RepID=A0A8C4QUS1_EPTBU